MGDNIVPATTPRLDHHPANTFGKTISVFLCPFNRDNENLVATAVEILAKGDEDLFGTPAHKGRDYQKYAHASYPIASIAEMTSSSRSSSRA